MKEREQFMILRATGAWMEWGAGLLVVDERELGVSS